METRRGCAECGEIQTVRNGLMERHNQANGTTCPGSRTVGVTLSRIELQGRDI